MTEYTISEISRQTGIARRNIHFYVQQGLLPPPSGAGLGARYEEEHLLRLKAIPLLRKKGLRLDEIRERLAGMNLRSLRGLTIGAIGDNDRLRSSLPDAQFSSRRILRPPQPSSSYQSLRRYSLAPGVELMVDGRAQPALQDHVEKLSKLVEDILEKNGDSRSHGGK